MRPTRRAVERERSQCGCNCYSSSSSSRSGGWGGWGACGPLLTSDVDVGVVTDFGVVLEVDRAHDGHHGRQVQALRLWFQSWCTQACAVPVPKSQEEPSWNRCAGHCYHGMVLSVTVAPRLMLSQFRRAKRSHHGSDVLERHVHDSWLLLLLPPASHACTQAGQQWASTDLAQVRAALVQVDRPIIHLHHFGKGAASSDEEAGRHGRQCVTQSFLLVVVWGRWACALTAASSSSECRVEASERPIAPHAIHAHSMQHATPACAPCNNSPHLEEGFADLHLLQYLWRRGGGLGAL